MSQQISVECLLKRVDENLTLQIPLADGGDKLVPLARAIGQVIGDNLVVIVLPWLADILRIGDGSLVVVDNHNGKFNITRSAKNDDPQLKPD
jgi:hypothetical protein